MEIKYTVELEVSEEVIKTFGAAHLSLDNLVRTKIETVLSPVTRGAISVYKAFREKGTERGGFLRDGRAADG